MPGSATGGVQSTTTAFSVGICTATADGGASGVDERHDDARRRRPRTIRSRQPADGVDPRGIGHAHRRGRRHGCAAATPASGLTAPASGFCPGLRLLAGAASGFWPAAAPASDLRPPEAGLAHRRRRSGRRLHGQDHRLHLLGRQLIDKRHALAWSRDASRAGRQARPSRPRPAAAARRWSRRRAPSSAGRGSAG